MTYKVTGGHIHKVTISHKASLTFTSFQSIFQDINFDLYLAEIVN